MLPTIQQKLHLLNGNVIIVDTCIIQNLTIAPIVVIATGLLMFGNVGDVLIMGNLVYLEHHHTPHHHVVLDVEVPTSNFSTYMVTFVGTVVGVTQHGMDAITHLSQEYQSITTYVISVVKHMVHGKDTVLSVVATLIIQLAPLAKLPIREV